MNLSLKGRIHDEPRPDHGWQIFLFLMFAIFVLGATAEGFWSYEEQVMQGVQSQAAPADQGF